MAHGAANAVTIYAHAGNNGVLYRIDTETMITTALNEPNGDRICCGPDIQITPDGSNIYW